jgi:hypothetical protein
MIDGALEISKNSLCCCPMSGSRRMHELTKLVNNKRNVWPSKGAILQCSYKMSVFRGIGNRAGNFDMTREPDTNTTRN